MAVGRVPVEAFNASPWLKKIVSRQARDGEIDQAGVNSIPGHDGVQVRELFAKALQAQSTGWSPASGLRRSTVSRLEAAAGASPKDKEKALATAAKSLATSDPVRGAIEAFFKQWGGLAIPPTALDKAMADAITSLKR